MKNLTKKELTEICFSLLHDKWIRCKTNQKAFESGRKKLLNKFKLLDNTSVEKKKFTQMIITTIMNKFILYLGQNLTR